MLSCCADLGRRVGVVLLVLSLLLPFAGCASMDSVKPGSGRTWEARGRSYEEIWRAAIQVMNEHADIVRQDQAQGIIIADRPYHFMGDNGWFGIFITPTSQASEKYRVEAVYRTRLYGQIPMQSWEQKLLRDIADTLEGRPLR